MEPGKQFNVTVGYGPNELRLQVNRVDERVYSVLYNNIPLCEIEKNKDENEWELVTAEKRVNPLLILDLHHSGEDKYRIMVDDYMVNCIGSEIDEHHYYLRQQKLME